MQMKIVSKTVHLGEDAYVRINADGSYSALAFGAFGPNQTGSGFNFVGYGWIPIKEEALPKEVVQALKGVKGK